MSDESGKTRALAEFEKRMVGSGFGELIGVQMASVADGECTLVLPYKPELSRGDNLIHGGVIAALIDKAGTAAAWSYRDIGPDARGATVALNVNYLSGADRCTLTAKAHVVRRGGSITVADVAVENPSAELVARGTVTYKLSNPRR